MSATEGDDAQGGERLDGGEATALDGKPVEDPASPTRAADSH
jgi:hypothetical protein